MIKHHYSEANSELGMEDNITLRGSKAYKYLEKVISLDKKIHLQKDKQNSKFHFIRLNSLLNL